jgi:hypothetical protein
MKTIILPRQARDKHRENSKKDAVFRTSQRKRSLRLIARSGRARRAIRTTRAVLTTTSTRRCGRDEVHTEKEEPMWDDLILEPVE